MRITAIEPFHPRTSNSSPKTPADRLTLPKRPYSREPSISKWVIPKHITKINDLIIANLSNHKKKLNLPNIRVNL